MNKAKVYHLKEDKYPPSFGVKTFFPTDYKLVARVDSHDEEEIFYLTNHVYCEWVDHPEVEVVGGRRQRSTSVGDVVEMPDGRVLRCDPSGWRELHISCDGDWSEDTEDLIF